MKFLEGNVFFKKNYLKSPREVYFILEPSIYKIMRGKIFTLGNTIKLRRWNHK